MPSIWVSDKDYETLIDIKADLEKHSKKPASFSDVVSHLMIKKRMLRDKSRKEIKNTRRNIRAKALTAAISALMLISLISVFQAGTTSAQATIDGEISVSEWGSPTWTITGIRANYNVHLVADTEALYLAFEYLGSDPTITPPTVYVNLYIDGNNNDVIDGLDKAFIFQNRNGQGGVVNWLRIYPSKEGNTWDVPPNYDDPNSFGYCWDVSVSPDSVPVRIGVSADRKVVEWRIPRDLVGATGESFGLSWQAFDSYNWNPPGLGNYYDVTTPVDLDRGSDGTIDVSFVKIQAAIDAASPGDTVLVGPGTYIQTADLVIDEEVSILGVSETKPTIQFDGEFSVVIKADNVLLEHLSFYKTNKEETWANFILEVPKGGPPNYESLYGGLAILDCVFEGGQDGAMYINMKGDFTVENSEFIDYAAYATIQIAAFDGTVTISGNEFTGSGRRVIVVEPGPSEQILHGGTMNIIRNTVVGTESEWSGSFFVYNHWANPSEKVDINIEKNILEDITGDAISIWTCGEADLSKLGSVKITGNTFSNIGKSAIIVNTTEAPSYGIPTNPVGKLSITANLNNFYSTVYGIKNEYVAEDPALSTIDATLNWWGDPTGPRNPTTNSSATGDDVSDNVDYMPWLDAPHPDGKARNWNVQNVDTGDNFNSIQTAINAAFPGDTVLVGPGTYSEAVVINKPMTLQGASRTNTVITNGIKFDTSAGDIVGVSIINFTIRGNVGTGVTIGHTGSGYLYDTTFDNNIFDGQDSVGMCFYIDPVAGNFTFTNNEATGYTDWGTLYIGEGTLDAGLGGPSLSTVTFENNYIHNNMGSSVVYGNPNDFTDNFVVRNNRFENNGGHKWFWAAIEINNAENVMVENNIFEGSPVGMEEVHGAALYFTNDNDGLISGNVVRNDFVNNYQGIYVYSGDMGGLEVHFNNFLWNNIAIDAQGEENPLGILNATLNWWGNPSGPSGVGPGTGDNVSVNVSYDPWLRKPLPTISDISVSGVTTTSATITWTTALPADSRVEYGPTIAYDLTSSIPYLTTSHSLSLTGLTPSTTYHFMVRSEDAYGHVDNSGDLTFITAAPPPPATLTVDTTPIKANVYVDGSLLGVAPRTRSLAAGTYTISFGDVLGYLTPAPEIVTLAAGETRTVTGVYKEIPPENIENQSPTYELPSITPEENTTIQIENTALTEITIQVENAAENVKITVQEVTEGAAGIAIGAPGTTYKYLNIVAENITDAQIGSVIIRFKVEKSWIILNDIDIATITLNHYDPLTSEWTSLPTTYLSEDDTYVYFSAISPGLSIFGVSGSATIPANFELSNLVITPSEVSVGRTVTISVVVNNAGGRTGSTTVTLEINGVSIDTQDVTLDAGESTTVTFTVSEDSAGAYTVNVAGLAGSFVVTALPAPSIVPLALGIIIIVMAIGIVMWLWRVRRKA